MDALRVKLLTAVNVQSAKPNKRKRESTNWHAVAKSARLERPIAAVAQLEEKEDISELNAFKQHFAAECDLLTDSIIEAARDGRWSEVSSKMQAINDVVELRPAGSSGTSAKGAVRLL